MEDSGQQLDLVWGRGADSRSSLFSEGFFGKRWQADDISYSFLFFLIAFPFHCFVPHLSLVKRSTIQPYVSEKRRVNIKPTWFSDPSKGILCMKLSIEVPRVRVLFPSSYGREQVMLVYPTHTDASPDRQLGQLLDSVWRFISHWLIRPLHLVDLCPVACSCSLSVCCPTLPASFTIVYTCRSI